MHMTLPAQMLRAYGLDRSQVPAWPSDDYETLYVFHIRRAAGAAPAMTFAVQQEGLEGTSVGHLPVTLSRMTVTCDWAASPSLDTSHRVHDAYCLGILPICVSCVRRFAGVRGVCMGGISGGPKHSLPEAVCYRAARVCLAIPAPLPCSRT